MSALVRVFERFIGRDLVYILAGAIPLLCIGRVFSLERYLCETENPNCLVSLDNVYWVWVAVAVGIAYAVGYALQELFCLLCLSSTAIEGEPGWFIQRLFLLYQHRRWEPTPREFNERNATLDLEMSGGQRFAADLERRVVLMQVGTALGPGAVVGGGFFIVWPLWPCLKQSFDVIDMIAGAVLLIAYLFFFVLRASDAAQGMRPWVATVAVISGIILVVSWLWPSLKQSIGAFDQVIGSTLLIAGLIFLVLGALKRAQLREYMRLVHQRLFPGTYRTA